MARLVEAQAEIAGSRLPRRSRVAINECKPRKGAELRKTCEEECLWLGGWENRQSDEPSTRHSVVSLLINSAASIHIVERWHVACHYLNKWSCLSSTLTEPHSIDISRRAEPRTAKKSHDPATSIPRRIPFLAMRYTGVRKGMCCSWRLTDLDNSRIRYDLFEYPLSFPSAAGDPCKCGPPIDTWQRPAYSPVVWLRNFKGPEDCMTNLSKMAALSNLAWAFGLGSEACKNTHHSHLQHKHSKLDQK